MVLDYDSTMSDPGRGAEWSIWDLHVHTPLSLHQNYGGDQPAVWERFFDELRSLPADIKVIGINDYWFIDGYRRVRQEFDAGRLPNLDAVFPVVEMRLTSLAGTDGHLRKINLHVIFDPALPVDTIEQQFVNRLNGKFDLAPGENHKWEGAVTRESLVDLGNQIKDSVPDKQKAGLGTPLQLGFSNLVVPLEDVQELLKSSYLKGKAVMAAGRAEWAEIKWSAQNAAIKKTLVNTPRLLFTAFADTSTWAAQRDKLKAEKVNHHLVDCSDAHYFSDSTELQRLGNCWTWMRTTPTFAGLLHAIDEFDQRVYVGLEPASLSRKRVKPNEYLAAVRITSDSAPSPKVFDYEVPLNDGFIAIVGNKGQGKSALLDCIALAGNSSRTEEFAFLNSRRFLAPSNRSAKDYYSRVTWADGNVATRYLDASHDRGSPVAVEYLPQSYVEQVCTTPPDSDESADFENELKEVLFTHIPEEDRERETTFDGLLARRTRGSVENVARLRDELVRRSARFEEIASFRASNRPEDIRKLIKAKGKDLNLAKVDLKVQQAALEQADAEGAGNESTVRLREEATELELQIAESKLKGAATRQAIAEQTDRASRADDLARRFVLIRANVSDLNRDAAEVGALPAPFAELNHRESDFADWRSKISESQANLRSELKLDEAATAGLEAKLDEVKQGLAAADGVRELARQRVLQSEARVKELIGDTQSDGSLAFLEALLLRAEAAPSDYAAAVGDLLEAAKDIHSGLKSELAGVASLYGPASDFIEGSEVVKNAGLKFRAELVISGRIKNVGNSVDNRRSPDLARWIGDMADRADPMDWASLRSELEVILVRLAADRGTPGDTYRDPAVTMRTATPLTEFLADLVGLTWLDVRFGLTGDGLPLSQLSPGQRGLVLALFYLVVDRRTTPLLLDQPEENLDNATIAKRLVPAIKEAASRRQTIIVTHNANLAIVGDADQIIHCTIDKKIFGATSGAISELSIAKSAVDILEGTMPAFQNRRHRYEVFPSLVKA